MTFDSLLVDTISHMLRVGMDGVLRFLHRMVVVGQLRNLLERNALPQRKDARDAPIEQARQAGCIVTSPTSHSKTSQLQKLDDLLEVLLDALRLCVQQS